LFNKIQRSRAWKYLPKCSCLLSTCWMWWIKDNDHNKTLITSNLNTCNSISFVNIKIRVNKPMSCLVRLTLMKVVS
jgi:hypothetical protein